MEVSIDEPLNVDWDGNELLLSDILGYIMDNKRNLVKLSEEIEYTKKYIDNLSIKGYNYIVSILFS